MGSASSHAEVADAYIQGEVSQSRFKSHNRPVSGGGEPAFPADGALHIPSLNEGSDNTRRGEHSSMDSRASAWQMGGR